ncbi:PX domain-containing protein, partial [Durusdinium trenchii]
VAPNGFTFPPDCATLRSENVSCFADMDNQASATVQGLHGSNVTLNVETPTKTPTPRSWLLAALNQKGSIVAWCEDKLGLSVAQIRSVAVVYPAVAGASAELAV